MYVHTSIHQLYLWPMKNSRGYVLEKIQTRPRVVWLVLGTGIVQGVLSPGGNSHYTIKIKIVSIRYFKEAKNKSKSTKVYRQLLHDTPYKKQRGSWSKDPSCPHQLSLSSQNMP